MSKISPKKVYHNKNPLYTCSCPDCKRERGGATSIRQIIRTAVEEGFNAVVLRNPQTGEERTIDISALTDVLL